MKWLFRAVGSAVAAFVLVAGAAIITVIWLMFSEGSTAGRRLGFFNAVFVEVREGDDGAVQLGAGLNDAIPLVIAVIAVTLFILAVMAVHDRLLERRKQLLADAD